MMMVMIQEARIRNKEDVEGSVIRENSEDPQDSGAYGSDYGEDHGTVEEPMPRRAPGKRSMIPQRK